MDSAGKEQQQEENEEEEVGQPNYCNKVYLFL